MKKKIYLLLMLLICLLSFNTVDATSFYSVANNSIMISKDNRIITNFTYANAFYENGSNRLAYCIEPFKIMTTDDNYREYSSFDNVFGVSREQLDRINKLAYYGYGYKNHTDNKWISITQMMIWRTVEPNGKFNWLNNLTDRMIIYPYENEIRELESLVASHNIKPSFITNTIYSMNDSLELNDSNGVLSDYRIKEATGVEARIDNNKLIIDSIDNSNEGEIKLIKGNEVEESKYYYSATSQNTMVRGSFTPIEVDLKVNIVKGSIRIHKVDKDLNINQSQGDSNLNGAIFELYYNNELVKEITLDENGDAFVDNLKLGEYVLKEKSPGEGYTLNKQWFSLDLNMDSPEKLITYSNKVIESKIKIIKYYGSKDDLLNGTMKKEKDIEFEIYNSKNELVSTVKTDEFGTAEILLPYGRYILKQVNTTNNYEMIEDQIIEVNENSPSEIIVELNDIEVEVPNAGLEESFVKRINDKCTMLLEALLS